MSMYRQIWLSLILTTVLSLVGGVLASTLSARGYVEEQLRMKNADNAASLALSLSQRKVDAVEIELTVAALFDNGHYESIRITDPHGKEMVSRTAISSEYDAPLWFVRCLPLFSAPGQAQISNGWNQVGTVTVVSNNRFAYKTLWQSTVQMVSALAFAGLLGGWLSTLILRRLKAPLNAVIAQAQAIVQRRFITTPESNIPELRQLTSAMNSTVLLLKKMFADEATRLDAVRQEANSDPLTGLSNRSYFMARLLAAVEIEDSQTGVLLLIRIANLAEINKSLGRAATDDFLKSIAGVLHAFAQKVPNALPARLNGADFGILLPFIEPNPIAEDLLRALIVATSAYVSDGPVAFIGWGKYSYGMNLGTLLTQVDAAVAGAEAEGINCVRAAAALNLDDEPHSNDQWLKLIRQALEQRETKLGFYPVTDFTNHLVHSECPLRLMFGSDWLPAGRFLPIAERLGLSSSLDAIAVALGVEELNTNNQLAGLAINLSARSLEDENFRQNLRSLLLANPAASKRLWLEVPENGAYAHFEVFSLFCKQLSDTGCRLGLEHFGRQFSQVGLLHDLNLDYLKVDASFVRDIQNNAGNQAFLKGLIGIAHNIGLKIFAEGVTVREELDTLAILGFDGATGPGVSVIPAST
jgi:EAL domain-containing protein (putative c-di-GMP-specific phosphodiesterase class I)/GGDEF domain-containing protein